MSDTTTWDIRDETYDSPSAKQLIDTVQAEYVERYGGPDESAVDPRAFDPPHGLFLVVYDAGAPVAMGGYRPHSHAEVEIKRMFVARSHRGRGLSRVVLARLEERARTSGAERIILETGLRQPEAISLYTTSGYALIEGFGHYADAPLSKSFAKEL